MTQRNATGPGLLICNMCERDGLPAGERFSVPADEIGVAIMLQHLDTEHEIVHPIVHPQPSWPEDHIDQG